MVLEILCVEPIYPQYSRVLETCLALRYWFFEVLGSESVNVLPIVCGSSLLVFVLLCITSFVIILKRKRELIGLLLLSYIYIVTINVMLLFLTVPWVGLQCVSFPCTPAKDI